MNENTEQIYIEHLEQKIKHSSKDTLKLCRELLEQGELNSKQIQLIQKIRKVHIQFL